MCIRDSIEGEEENKAAREVVPTTDNWEDIGHDAGIRYEEFVYSVVVISDLRMS